ncbi:TetR/AcrR family transcriptional regulator [Ketobacter sp. MCCC 1A13808]|uniref:TetR/AcrR family transcriptional regulator n=1 Tax=Ketobacter sp. MCCC 1A13808 TaxID=2602738 RepID=UPI0012ECAFB5|nr:TetR/AcrR family transcriptional regulator [Ketobacter sp. MCCC 1A13808]MVF13161.1 TetR/AcrR family transcriptional regulator [Ketobacter sp. MCCC 1A13808]
MPEAVTARKTALSRDRIINAAYKLAKKDPMNALSMRKIATVLKVTPMAIYKYFADKNELTAAVIDKQLTDSHLVPEEIDRNDWRLWLKTSFSRMWDAYDSAPNMIPYMTHATSFGPAVLQWQNETLGVLINAGLTPKQSLTAYAAMSELATGSNILVPVRERGVEKVFPTIWIALKNGTVPLPDEISKAHNSVEDYPWLLMCGQAMIEDMKDSRRAFINGLDLILDSVNCQILANQKAD